MLFPGNLATAVEEIHKPPRPPSRDPEADYDGPATNADDADDDAGAAVSRLVGPYDSASDADVDDLDRDAIVRQLRQHLTLEHAFLFLFRRLPPHTRRVTCRTWCTCLSDGLIVDACDPMMPGLRLQATLALFLHKRRSVDSQVDSMPEWSEPVAPARPARAATATAGFRFADMEWELPPIDDAAGNAGNVGNVGLSPAHGLATPVQSVRVKIEPPVPASATSPPSIPTRKGPNAAGKNRANKLAILRIAGQSRTGRHGATRAQSPSPSPSPISIQQQLPRRPPSPPLDTAGLLPADHRPARGRGRSHQLEKMTRVQIEAEAEARLEKNRQAARDCRLRRKQQVGVLQERVIGLENSAAEDQAYIAELEDREVQSQALVAALRGQIQRLEKSSVPREDDEVRSAACPIPAARS